MPNQRSRCFLRTSLVFCGVLLAGTLLGCGGRDEVIRQPQADRSLAHPEVLAQVGLQYYWQRPMVLGAGEAIETMYLRDDILYFITNQRRLVAIDAAVGNPLWRVVVSTKEETIYPPMHVDNVMLTREVGDVDTILDPPSTADMDEFNAVMMNTMTRVLVINRDNGILYRDFPFFEFSASTQGCGQGQRYFVAGVNNLYYGVNLLSAVNSWTKDLGEMVTAPMRCYEGRVYMGSLSGTLRCFTADGSGVELWTRTLDGPVMYPFHVDARGVFIAGGNKQLYGLNPRTNRWLWEPVRVSGRIDAAPQVGENTIFLHADEDGLYAISIDKGQVRWKKPRGRTVAAVIDGYVYLLDDNGNLQIINEITGETEHTVALTGMDFILPNTTAPAIYAATRNGGVFCINPTDVGHLTSEMLKQ